MNYPISPNLKNGEDEQARIKRLLQNGTKEQCIQEALYWINYYIEIGEDLESIEIAQSLLIHFLQLSHIALPKTLADSIYGE